MSFPGSGSMGVDQLAAMLIAVALLGWIVYDHGRRLGGAQVKRPTLRELRQAGVVYLTEPGPKGYVCEGWYVEATDGRVRGPYQDATSALRSMGSG